MSSSSISLGKHSLPREGVVNVYGKNGCGKTTFFTKMKHVVKFDHDILRSKEKTNDFMNMMRHSFVPLVLDDYELVENLPGISEIRKLRVPMYIISTNKVTSLDCVTSHYEFPEVSVEEFAESLGKPVELVRTLLQKANGNMTTVKLDLENFESERDVFMGSKEYVEELILAKTDQSKFIDRHLAEHGNTFGIVHENYPDFSTDFATISHSLSDADLIDRAIYTDMSWELMPFFNVSACVIPSMYMDGDAAQQQLRPGSVWTKTSNMLMKRNRLKKLQGVHRDCVQIWAQKINAGEADAVTKKFSSYDLDSINQLSFTKIKPRALTSLKKKCPRKE